MNNTKHTPGPWSIGQSDDIYNVMIQDLKGVNIAEIICHFEKDQRETQANARLIREAPNLLSVLKLISEQIPDNLDTEEDLRSMLQFAVEMANQVIIQIKIE